MYRIDGMQWLRSTRGKTAGNTLYERVRACAHLSERVGEKSENIKNKPRCVAHCNIIYAYVLV